MSVDLEAIAQRGRCDVTSLRLAIPLLEQGYSPPFLARYRRDELGGLDESSLWALASSLQTEQQIQHRRDELVGAWERTSLCDPALGNAIKKSNSLRMLNRLGRRLKNETGDAADDATRLAVRVLNPQKGDPENFSELATRVEGIQDAAKAAAGIDAALARRLAGDPRMIAAAVRWLTKNARILVSTIHDPHLHSDEEAASDRDEDSQGQAAHPLGQSLTSSQDSTPHDGAPQVDMGHDVAAHEDAGHDEMSHDELSHDEMAHDELSDAEMIGDLTAESDDAALTASDAEPTSIDELASSGDAIEEGSASDVPVVTQGLTPTSSGKKAKQKGASAKQDAKKQKKVSPRQRRRRWLVGVLKPLEGKRFSGDKLSAFQIVMLGRALRSQVAQCAFEYDATKLVAELQRTAGSLNRGLESHLRQIVLDHEADIRESAEAAWWDDLHEKASSRLVTITADHLRRHVNRGGVDAKVVMAIDAIGPRTAAASIVCADGRILHNEDLPCQLSAAQRSQAVARMGELIHTYHVDLIVISNGPARRASMIALGDLISQSPDKSVRWTLADRSGADVYASSSIADDEMRSTPRRFRAAAWLAFSVLQPAQSLAKIDPLKLRLSSFQRELADEAMSAALEDVMISGASRGGVDVNSAPVSWLMRLPGITREVAKAIDQARRASLFPSRQAVSELAEWSSITGSRQALPFLRVFGSDEVLDGTLVHPDDYILAKKLANALGIELPPKTPPGYSSPKFSADEVPVSSIKIAEAPTSVKPITVEDFTNAGDRAKEFSLEETPAAETPPTSTEADLSAEAVLSAEDGTASDAVASTSDAGPSSSSDVDSQASEASEKNTASKLELPEPVRHPLPDRAKIDKCVKEWQIGSRRAHQLVQWLCDPFGDSDLSGSAPAVLTTIPASKALKPGDMVIGVVVGVMPFGVFVELAPDCSGLVHVSRVSDSYVEDLHEAVQVGDVITAWVTGIDEKRRRVALTAVSPEREAEIEAARRARDQRSQPSGPYRGGRDRGPAGPRSGGESNQGARTGSRSAAPAGAGPPRGGQSRGGQSRGGQGQASQAQPATGQAATGQAAQGRSGASAREGNRSGGPPSRGGSAGRGAASGRGDRGQGRQGASRDSRGGPRSRDKKPESYRVSSKPEAKPITDAMQKGDEPLRSFGDLMQFFGKATSSKPTEQTPPAGIEPAGNAGASEAVDSATDTVSGSDQGHGAGKKLSGVEIQESTRTNGAMASDEPAHGDDTARTDSSTLADTPES